MNDVKTKTVPIEDKGFARLEDREYEMKFECCFTHRPSWRNYGEGTAFVEVRHHRPSKTINLCMTESPEEGRGGKTVMVTLPPLASRALYEMLKGEFESK